MKPLAHLIRTSFSLALLLLLSSCGIPNAGEAVKQHAMQSASPMGMMAAREQQNNFWR